MDDAQPELAEQRAVRAALAAIEDAAYRINQTLEQVGTAADLARADFWGGGLVTSSMKRDRIARVSTMMRSVELSLSEVRERLDALGSTGTDSLRVGSVPPTSTIDVWLDNVFSDVRSRRRLKQARTRLDVVGRALVRIQSDLNRRDRRLTERIDGVEA